MILCWRHMHLSHLLSQTEFCSITKDYSYSLNETRLPM